METKSIDKTEIVATVPQAAVAKQELRDRRELIKAIKAINATEVFGSNYELTFVMDRFTSRPLMRIVDRQTHEVIRQFPSEYLVRLAEQMRNK